MRTRLLKAKNDLTKKAGEKRWKKVAARLHKAEQSAKAWRPARGGFGALAAGLDEVRRDGRKAMARARESGDARDLHAWRKLVKAHWYELRLLGP